MRSCWIKFVQSKYRFWVDVKDDDFDFVSIETWFSAPNAATAASSVASEKEAGCIYSVQF